MKIKKFLKTYHKDLGMVLRPFAASDICFIDIPCYDCFMMNLTVKTFLPAVDDYPKLHCADYFLGLFSKQDADFVLLNLNFFIQALKNQYPGYYFSDDRKIYNYGVSNKLIKKYDFVIPEIS